MADLLLGLLEAILVAATVVVVCGAVFVLWPTMAALLLGGIAEGILRLSRLLGRAATSRPVAPSKSDAVPRA